MRSQGTQSSVSKAVDCHRRRRRERGREREREGRGEGECQVFLILSFSEREICMKVRMKEGEQSRQPSVVGGKERDSEVRHELTVEVELLQ